jgi:hypothetical protein
VHPVKGSSHTNRSAFGCTRAYEKTRKFERRGSSIRKSTSSAAPFRALSKTALASARHPQVIELDVPISEPRQDACESTSATLNQPNFPYPRSRFLVISSITDTLCGLTRKSTEPSSELQEDMAFHDAFARFGGRRGFVEGIDLYARMYGLPLTPLVVRIEPFPAITSCRERIRPNQDRVSHALVKVAQRVVPPRDAFLRNAIERLHLTPSRGGVRGLPPLRGGLRLDRRDDPLT